MPVFTLTQILQATYSNFTSGSVIFQGANNFVNQNNTKLFWDNTNFRLGIGTASPAKEIDVTGTGSVRTGAILGASTTPTIAFSTGAGTGAVGSVATGTQAGGFINFQTGTTPAVGLVFTITFPIAPANYIFAVFQPGNAAAAGVYSRCVTSSSGSTVTFSTTGSALAAGTVYQFNYITVSN